MSQIKLLHSGGNGVILSAPDSNPASDRTLKLPGDADGTIATTATAGKILQVLQAVKTDTFSSASTTYTNITGLNLAITPSATSSKILVNVSFNHQSNTQDRWRAFQITRGSTAIYIGDANGYHTRASVMTTLQSATGDGSTIENSFIQFLDSPNTTSATTYYLQGKVQSGGASFVINRPRNTDNADYIGAVASSITLMEVAG